MIVPNKVTAYQESMISKMLNIVEQLEVENKLKVINLFNEVSHEFEGVEEFMYSLEVLFLLEVINVDTDSGVVSYVKTNKL